MKKPIIIILTIVIANVSVIGIKYYNYTTQYDSIIKENAKFEEYKDKEITGIELVTLMNRTVDKNTKNKIEKDENGIFIPNEENSIEIEIYMQDNQKTYKMETIYNAGTEQFIKYYRDIKFKCSKIEYHTKTGRVKYMLFEQLETS